MWATLTLCKYMFYSQYFLQDEDSNIKHREEWMTELPPELSKNFGLQNRQFSRGSGRPETGGDRSIWTDTPQSRKEKVLMILCLSCIMQVIIQSLCHRR